MKRTILIITLLFIVSSLSVFAQTKLSGKWISKGQESVDGRVPINGTPKAVTITVKDNAITFDKVFAQQDGDQQVKETANLDGKPTANTMVTPNRKKTVSFEKKGDVFIGIISIYDATENKLLRLVTETWSMTNDLLSLDRKVDDKEKNSTFECKATYHKN